MAPRFANVKHVFEVRNLERFYRLLLVQARTTRLFRLIFASLQYQLRT